MEIVSRRGRKFLFICCLFLLTLSESLGSDLESESNSTFTYTIIKTVKEPRYISNVNRHWIVSRDGVRNEKHRLNSEFCDSKSRCESNATDRNCNCDKFCRLLGDCCSDINDTKTSFKNFLKRAQFKCVHFNSLNGSVQKAVSILMVSKCQDLWTDSKSKGLCEEEDATGDIFLSLPVSSTETNIIFRNMYCAYCNYISEFEYWTFDSVCLDQNTNDTCIFFNINDTRHFRQCGNEDIVSTCSKTDNYIIDNNQITELCESESVLLVYDQNDKVYKNKYCAICNEVDDESLFCEGTHFPKYTGKNEINIFYSYRLLVDFNSRQYQKENEGQTVDKAFEICSNVHEEVYDPMSKTCRKLYCPNTFTAIKGKCIPNENLPNSTKGMEHRCAFVKLQPDEYEIQNVTSILVLRLNMTVGSSMFYRNGSDIYMCADIFRSYTIRPISFYFDRAEEYVSFCGITSSVISLFITLSVYMVLPELRNIPGKNLISLMVALLLAQLLFLCLNQAFHIEIVCKALAVITHYFYLASFSWMNVIAFDLFMTFSHSLQPNKSNAHMQKQFYRYSLYGWLVPAAIVTAAVILDNSNIDDNQFKPRYGENVCWISSRKALILLFFGPLAVFKLFDVIAFLCSSFYISKSRRQGSMVRRYNFCSFLLYLKLSLIMGLTWLFAFVAAFSNNTVMWYLFIIFNTLQGVFISLSFLCTKRVKRLIRGKFMKRENVDSSSGTPMTLLRRSL